jgi:hypothetical protein
MARRELTFSQTYCYIKRRKADSERFDGTLTDGLLTRTLLSFKVQNIGYLCHRRWLCRSRH